MAGHESIATSLLVLKAFAKNPDADYAEISKLTDKPENIVAEIVKEYVSVYLSQEADSDFPALLIAQYKDKSGNDLSMEDFEGLVPLVDDFRRGNDGEEEEDDDNNGLPEPGERERPRARTENLKSRGAPKAGSRMSLPRNNRYDNNNSGGSQTTQSNLPDLSTNSALMRWVLERTKSASTQPAAIKNFMEMFELQENLLIREPQRLLQHLIFGFGELPGQSAFSNFMNLRPQFVYDINPSQTIYGQAGMAGMGQPGGMGMGVGMNYGQPNANPLLNNPQYQQMMLDEQMEDIRDRREERKDRQDERKEAAVQRRMYVQQMANMVQSQTPMNPNMMMGQMGMGGMGMGTGGLPMAFKEVVDKDGKPVSREWYPRAPGSSPNGEDSNSKILFQMLQEANKDNKEMVHEMFSNMNKNNSLPEVIKTIKEVKELGNDMFGERRGGTETPETLGLRMDMADKVMHGKMELRKLQHEWQREREDRISSQETMKGWFDGINGIVTGATQTVLPEFMRGIGMATGKYRAAQQAQMGGQQQQAAASYQQQQAMIQQQQQQQIRQQQMAAQQAAAAAAQNNNPMYQQQGGGMSFAPQQYSAPAPAPQQQQRQPQPDRMAEVMRQHEISDQDFFDASDEDLEQMARQFEHGVRQLGSMHNRIDEERSRRRHTRQSKQARQVIMERDQQKAAREAEAAARTRAATVPSELPTPTPVVREQPPASAPSIPEPEPVKAAAQPQIERPPQSAPKEPVPEQEESVEADTGEEYEDDDGEGTESESESTET